MSARERELQVRHAQLVAQLERERQALAESLRGLTSDTPRLARKELREQLRDNWPALTARLAQSFGSLLLARRGAGLPVGWLALALGLLRRPRAVALSAVVAAIAAALWRAQKAPSDHRDPPLH